MATSDPLDFYHHWLGIPPDEQPASHYRLLGLRVFESDPMVITNAADRQMAHVKCYLNGPHWEMSTQLLNELGLARLCLLNPETRQDYDRQIRRTMFPPEAPPRSPEPSSAAPPVAAPEPSSGVPEWDEPAQTQELFRSPTGSRNKRYKQRKNDSTWLWGFLILIVVFVAVAAIAVRPFDQPIEPKPPIKVPALPGKSSGNPPALAPAPAPPGPTVKPPKNKKNNPGGVSGDNPSKAERPLFDIVRIVEHSVVQIEADGRTGSGVIVGDQLVLTNNHVIARASQAQIKLVSGTVLKVLGRLAVDPSRDLALLKSEPSKEAIAIRIAKDLPQKLEKVVAFGSPDKLAFSASDGRVSAIRSGKEIRETLGEANFDKLGYGLETTWIQHTAPISGGSSGGPLVNMQGELIGLNTWARSGANIQSLNFAIGAPDIRQLMEDAEGLAPLNFQNLPNPVIDGEHENEPGQADEPQKPKEAEKPNDIPNPENANERGKDLTAPFPSGNVFSPELFGAVKDKRAPTFDEKDPGLIVIKDENGQFCAVASHVHGQLHGVTFSVYPNNKAKVYATYFNGKRHGFIETWSDRGAPTLFAQYRMGRRHGFTCLFEGGEVRMLIEYRNDKPVWIRLISSGRVVEGFPGRAEADENSEARDVLVRLDGIEAKLKSDEAAFRKQVSDIEKLRREELRRLIGPEARSKAIARFNERSAADAAAIREISNAADQETNGRSRAIFGK